MTIEAIPDPSFVSRDQPGSLATLDSRNPILPLLQQAMEKGMSPEVMQGYFQLFTQMEDRQSKKDFATALAELQANLPVIVAQKSVVSKNQTLYVYAPFDAIMEEIKPFLLKHKFTVSFDSRSEESRIIEICILSHGGHQERFEYSVRIGTGPPNSSQTQADGAAHMYARRGALCNALNIVVDKDNDARHEGDFITQDQANGLRRRVKAMGRDEVKFLAIADAPTFEEIRVGKWRILTDLLNKAEKSKAMPTNGAGTSADTTSIRSAPASAGAQTPSQPTGSELADIKAQEFADGNDAAALRKWMANMRSVAPKKLEAVLTVCQISDIRKASDEAIKHAAKDLKAIMLKAEGQ